MKTGVGTTFKLSRGPSETIFFIDDELGDAGEIGLNSGHQLIAVGMVVRNFVENFADDFVLAVVFVQVGMVGVIGVHLRVHGNCELEHFGAHGFHFRFGVGEDLFGGDRRFHHEAEFFVVQRFAEAPGAGLRALGERVMEKIGIEFQRTDGGGSFLGVAGGEFGARRDLLFERGFDEVDVAVIFFHGGFDPDGIGIGDVGLDLDEEAGNLAHAIEDVAESDFEWRVILSERQEDGVADEFDGDGGIVFVALDFIVFEKVEADLIVDELPVGGVFRIERGYGGLGAEAFAARRRRKARWLAMPSADMSSRSASRATGFPVLGSV